MKGQSADEVLALLGEVERGEVALSPGLAGRILQELAKEANTLSRLIRTGNEVLRLVAQGFKYKEVATKLDLTERTVKFQMADRQPAATPESQPGPRIGAAKRADWVTNPLKDVIVLLSERYSVLSVLSEAWPFP